MAGKRPALIFDFGNVLVFFDYGRVGEKLGKPLGLRGGEFIDKARARGFTPLHIQYESGKLTSEEFSRAVCDLMGLDLTHREFAAAWEDMFWLNEPVAALVAGLKRLGYTLVLGSNTNALHADFNQRRFAEALAPFDRLVFSHDVGHVKPAAEFYLACAAAAGADPADCIFVDDIPENVEGAANAGLRGILFRDPEGLRAALRREGVELPD